MTYRRPELLGPAHEVQDFLCTSLEQEEWLVRHARQSMATGTARVFVVTTSDSPIVVGYYAWSMGSVTHTDAPNRLRKGAGRYPQPIALLARLGVHQYHQGAGLGAALLLDVVQRVAAMSEEIGCRGLVVHCESQSARDFYLHVLPEFVASPTDELHLYLLLKDIRRTFQTARPS